MLMKQMSCRRLPAKSADRIRMQRSWVERDSDPCLSSNLTFTDQRTVIGRLKLAATSQSSVIRRDNDGASCSWFRIMTTILWTGL